MPALDGQVIINSPDGNGNPRLTVTWFFNPNGLSNSRPLRNNPNAWTDPWGTVWPANTASFMAINTSGIVHRLRVSNALGLMLRTLPMPLGSSSQTVAQLVLGGLFLDARDFNGATIEVA